jgi:[NiFe] hydrogenase assembly HybE family chaperone
VTATFEGSYLGDSARLSPDARLECGVCWHVYDPAIGDAAWQIPAGTPFNALPEHWTCPDCNSPRHKFMVLDGDGRDTTPDPLAVAGRLEAAYRASEARIIGLPIHNPRLKVESLGFRRHFDGAAGVIITPWMMAIVRVPDQGVALTGTEILRLFPAGEVPMIAGDLAQVGAIESCSLFSPMDEFADMDAARLAAEAAIEGLFTAPEPPAPPKPQPRPETKRQPEAVDRRRLLFGASPS